MNNPTIHSIGHYTEQQHEIIHQVDDGFIIKDDKSVCRAKLFGSYDDGHYIITKIEIFDQCGTPIIYQDNQHESLTLANSLINHIRTIYNKATLTILSWGEKVHENYEQLLIGLGYKVDIEKYHYSKNIFEYKSLHHDPFIYLNLTSLPVEDCIELFSSIRQNDHAEKLNIPTRQSFDGVFSNYNEHFALNWKLATLNNRNVGIILPDIFPDTPKKGTLAYIGILPEFQKKGYSKILHAKGLEELSKLGVSEYIGSTHIKNISMQKCFKANDCSLVGVRKYWTHENF